MQQTARPERNKVRNDLVGSRFVAQTAHENDPRVRACVGSSEVVSPTFIRARALVHFLRVVVLHVTAGREPYTRQ